MCIECHIDDIHDSDILTSQGVLNHGK
jgi:hypothetical protein